VAALARRGYAWEMISFALDKLKNQAEEE